MDETPRLKFPTYMYYNFTIVQTIKDMAEEFVFV